MLSPGAGLEHACFSKASPVGLSAGPGGQHCAPRAAALGPRTRQCLLYLKDHLLYSGTSSCQSVDEGAFLVAPGRPAHMKQHTAHWWNQYLVFPDGASGKESACQCRRHKRHRFDPWVRKTTLKAVPFRVVHGTSAWKPTPVLLPENPMDREAWWATVHRVAKSRTPLK